MPASHPLPSTIGKYRIIKELGRGASSVVYLGEDPFTDRHVAIKQIHAHLIKDPARAAHYRRSLRHEARLAGGLRHPHIVGVLDVDVESNPPFLVLEYLQGRTLSVYATADHLLPVAQVLDIAYKCCSALHYAHHSGLVHRDIKPANLMLQPDGNLKVTDFGMAYSTTGDDTQVEGMVGSPLYMSPEQVSEQKPSYRSDMFSLGVVLYELLTGRQPFQAETEFAVLYKIGNEEPPPPSTLRPGLPHALDAVIAKAMSKKPKDRYDAWPEFGDALMEITRSLTDVRVQDRESERFVQMRVLPFFAGFHDAALWETLRLGTLREFKAGGVLMQEGTKGESFLIILEGSIAVQRQGVHLVTLEAGVTLGEMCYLQPDHPVRSASAIAETDVAAVEIRNAALRLASEDLQMLFDKAFIKLMVTRLMAANQKLGVAGGIDLLLGENA